MPRSHHICKCTDYPYRRSSSLKTRTKHLVRTYPIAARLDQKCRGSRGESAILFLDARTFETTERRPAGFNILDNRQFMIWASALKVLPCATSVGYRFGSRSASHFWQWLRTYPLRITTPLFTATAMSLASISGCARGSASASRLTSMSDRILRSAGAESLA